MPYDQSSPAPSKWDDDCAGSPQEDRSHLCTSNILLAMFTKGVNALQGDLERALALRKAKKLGHHPWRHFTEGQFDLFMARGYEHLSREQKDEMLPVGYRKYHGSAEKGDLCFVVASETGTRICVMGETKFIRDKKKSANEKCLLKDALKPCHYMVWFFAGRHGEFLPPDSRLAAACARVMRREEDANENAGSETLAVADEAGKERVFIGAHLGLRAPRDDGTSLVYEGFIWVWDQQRSASAIGACVL